MCKNRNGVLGIVIGVLLIVASQAVGLPHASAAQSSSRSYSRTTKGVRTTAYNKRPYRATSPVTLPPETEATAESLTIVERVKSAIGSRYSWGGTDKTGFDCSGLARYSLGEKAASLPRSSAALHGAVASSQDLRPGDLIFFGRGRTSHVAIYIGNRRVVHASTYGRRVREDSLDQLVRALGWRGVGRI